MDKVRFTVGDARVWQGYNRKGEGGMVGATVFLTADTLRRVTDALAEDLSDFDRAHNAPEGDWATLAFGAWTGATGNVRLAPDGMTPLYELTSVEAVIVQRFDPTIGRTYQRHIDGVIETVPYGQWVNEDTLDSFQGGVEGWEAIPQGFVIDPQGWSEGRTDAPPIDTERSRAARVAMIEGQEYVVDIYVPVCVTVRANKGDEAMARDMALEQLDEETIRTRIEQAIEPTSFYFSDSPYRTEVGEG